MAYSRNFSSISFLSISSKNLPLPLNLPRPRYFGNFRKTNNQSTVPDCIWPQMILNHNPNHIIIHALYHNSYILVPKIILTLLNRRYTWGKITKLQSICYVLHLKSFVKYTKNLIFQIKNKLCAILWIIVWPLTPIVHSRLALPWTQKQGLCWGWKQSNSALPLPKVYTWYLQT